MSNVKKVESVLKRINSIIQDLIYKLEMFDEIVNMELKNEILQNEDVIREMIAEEQLYEKGIDGLGRVIMSYMPYSNRTIIKKQRKGQPFDRVTLRDTGKFHSSLHVEFDDDGFRIISVDNKSKYLLGKYGKAVINLTDENLAILLKNYIKPSLIEKIKNKMLND